MIYRLLALIFMVTIWHNAMSQRSRAAKIFKKVNPSVVTIYSHDDLHTSHSQGSGVVIDKSGLVVTNFHLIDNAGHLIIKHKEKQITDVEILAVDVNKDMMLLKISDNIFPPVKLAKIDKLNIGEIVFAIGSPKGYENTISEGIVSGIREASDSSMSYIQVTCPLSEGSSGGAIVNSKGELIGISTYVTGGQAQNINFAIPASYFYELVNKDHYADKVLIKTYLDLGGYEYLKDHYSDAIYYYDKVLAIDPNNVPAYYNLGLCYQYKGESRLAMYYFTKALELDEQIKQTNIDSIWNAVGAYTAGIYKYLGDYYYKKGDVNRSIKFYKQYISNSETENAEVYTKLATGYTLNKNYRLAIKNAKKAASVNPLSSDAYLCLATAYFRQCFPYAGMSVKELFGAPGSNQHDHMIKHYHEYINNNQSKLDSAIYYATFAVSLNSKNESVYRILGLAYFKKGDHEKSIENYKKLLYLNPSVEGYKNIYRFLSISYENLGDYDNYIHYKELNKKSMFETENVVDTVILLDKKYSGTAYRKTIEDSLSSLSISSDLEKTSIGKPAKTECAVVLGGSRYINCENMIVFKSKTVLTIDNWNDKLISINYNIYSPSGILLAVIEKGKIKQGDPDLFQLIYDNSEYLLIEKSSQKVVCHVRKEMKGGECEYLMWGNLYMPDGFSFQFTPEQTNVPFLNMLKGGTFKNSRNAIILN